MFLYEIIIKFILIFKLVKADLVLCANNECTRAGVIQMDSLLHELDVIKEGNQNNTMLLKELNERIDHKISSLATELDNVTKRLYQKPNKLTETPLNQKQEDKDTEDSFYDDLWIVIQRRQDGSVDFFRSWSEYKEGFGDQTGEFFVGLEKIHRLTNYRNHELLVILEDFVGNIKYAHYDDFSIGDESKQYILKKIGKYTGTAGDHLRLHVNMLFTTKDRDNDEADEGNCAEWFKGAWWYYHCLTSNLNGPYRHSRILNDNERGIGITWGSFDDIKYSYKTVQMMIRSKKKSDNKN